MKIKQQKTKIHSYNYFYFTDEIKKYALWSVNWEQIKLTQVLHLLMSEYSF
jgi:hypothetical protein